MFRPTLCAFLAPAIMAMPWAGPEPTLFAPEIDHWSPAPTPAPQFGLEMMKRQDPGDNTCGYISGNATRSLTCNNSLFVCATNSINSVHGCCDPAGLSSCSLATACIPSSLVSASCASLACQTNSFIKKCTISGLPYCYEWRYVYPGGTVMTEHGCAASEFTVSVSRLYDGLTLVRTSSDVPVVVSVSIVTVTGPTTPNPNPASSSTLPPAPPQSSSVSPVPVPGPGKKTNIGAIVGGVIGGLVVLGALAFGIIALILRNRRRNNAAQTAPPPNAPAQPTPMSPTPGVAEYKPAVGGFTPSPQPQFANPAAGAAGFYHNEQKTYPQVGVAQHLDANQPYSPPMTPAPQYSSPTQQHAMPVGMAEAAGTPIQPPVHNGQPQVPPQQNPQPQQQQHGNVYEAP